MLIAVHSVTRAACAGGAASVVAQAAPMIATRLRIGRSPLSGTIGKIIHGLWLCPRWLITLPASARAPVARRVPVGAPGCGATAESAQAAGPPAALPIRLSPTTHG